MSEKLHGAPSRADLPLIDSDYVDVRKRIDECSVEELCETADAYFARLENTDYLLAKPLAQVDEAPELLQCFAHVVQALELVPDMTVLDFGAGACWTSRFMTQLGMHVIAVDVSASALRIGQQLYERMPPVGNVPPARFVASDGHRIELPDASVDRITCFEALHHVPNVAEVLREMARVLKPGGMAGFSEPGPTHSRAPQSQAEMRNYRVIENDVVVEDIWRIARDAGFNDIRIAAFSPRTALFGLETFRRFVAGSDGEVVPKLVADIRSYLAGRRLFVLAKGGEHERLDSRRREGLRAQIDATIEPGRASDRLRLRATVRNTGHATWLGKSARVGAVHLGIHLYDRNGALIAHGYHVHYGVSDADGETPVAPGERRQMDFEFRAPPPGDYVFEVDLVSGGVAWFAHCGTVPVRIPCRLSPC